MYKELAITIIIVVLIIVGNIITQNNTNKCVQRMSEELNKFREEIIFKKINKEQAKSQIQNIENVWREETEKLAYYIEHDEIEKAETELTKLKADIEVEEYSIAVENLDNCIFLLEHIKDKSALKIVNVF